MSRFIILFLIVFGIHSYGFARLTTSQMERLDFILADESKEDLLIHMEDPEQPIDRKHYQLILDSVDLLDAVMSRKPGAFERQLDKKRNVSVKVCRELTAAAVGIIGAGRCLIVTLFDNGTVRARRQSNVKAGLGLTATLQRSTNY